MSALEVISSEVWPYYGVRVLPSCYSPITLVLQEYCPCIEYCRYSAPHDVRVLPMCSCAAHVRVY